MDVLHDIAMCIFVVCSVIRYQAELFDADV